MTKPELIAKFGESEYNRLSEIVRQQLTPPQPAPDNTKEVVASVLEQIPFLPPTTTPPPAFPKKKTIVDDVLDLIS